MNKLTVALVFVLLGLFDTGLTFTNAETIKIAVDKKLKNGDPLPEDKITSIQVSYECGEGNPIKIGQIVVSPSDSLHKADVTLYFANEVKNILQVSVTRQGFTGKLYDVPHALTPRDTSDSSKNKFRYNGFDRYLTISEDWFPSNTNKVSASVEVDGEIYNIYGNKNYPISIPDTMVVENFRNMTCKA